MLTFVSRATHYIESVTQLPGSEAPPLPLPNTFVNNKTSTSDEILLKTQKTLTSCHH